MGSRKMDNNGSAVVEICIIAPLLVCVIFFIINIMIIMVDESIITGNAYLTLYNSYEYNISGYGDYDCAAMESEFMTAMETVPYAGGIQTDVKWNDSGIISNLFGGAANGRLTMGVEYDVDVPGGQLLLQGGKSRKSVVVYREIRDTSGNLRRWQRIGELSAE